MGLRRYNVDLPKELFYKLKEDIEKTTLNTDMIEKSKELLERLLKERIEKTK